MTNISLFTISYAVTSDQTLKTNIDKYFLVGCLVASVLRDRIEQFFNKMFTFFLITITSWTIKKQRRRSAVVFMVLNCLFFIPYGLFQLSITSILSAPLLALFTFPVYLIGKK